MSVMSHDVEDNKTIAKPYLEVLGDFTNETLEGSLRMRSSVDFW